MKDWLIEHKVMVNGQPVVISYDKEADILEIIFQKGGGIGVDLTENITLRYNQDSRMALSVILTSLSLLTKPTPFGPPSFQLTALKHLPPEMQKIVLDILNAAPVNHFLKISGLQLTPGGELYPITFLEQPVTLAFDQIPA
jgi:hypothetical protein